MGRRVFLESRLVSAAPPLPLYTTLFRELALFSGTQSSDPSPGNPALPVPSSRVPGVIASLRCRTDTDRDLETLVRLAQAWAPRSLGDSQGTRDIVSPFGTGPGGESPKRGGAGRGPRGGEGDLGAKAAARPVHDPEGIEAPPRGRSRGDPGPHRRSHPVLRSPARLHLQPTCAHAWSAGLALGRDPQGRPGARDPAEASPPQDALATARVASKETPGRSSRGRRRAQGPPPPPRPRRLLPRGAGASSRAGPARRQDPPRRRPRRPAVHAPRVLRTRARLPGPPIGAARGTRGRQWGRGRGDVAGRLPSGGDRETPTAGCSLRSGRKCRGRGRGARGPQRRRGPAPAPPATRAQLRPRHRLPGQGPPALKWRALCSRSSDRISGPGPPGGHREPGKDVREGDPGGSAEKGDAPLWPGGREWRRRVGGTRGQGSQGDPSPSPPQTPLLSDSRRGPRRSWRRGSQLLARPPSSLDVPERVKMGKRPSRASWPLALKQHLHRGRH
ncbi:collagen alpha-1(I) chain-like [Hippopotamus amphibius kiboko]|uniref:collagen alpha-1(I) chain-like n=1 Tax=Hippopotamus amphibius kiboko TaxID=575201 RepID=UPI0025941DBE|nr:collagen alpha-1(I) chain-like [Hippopotamus amphibius kiboko]